jgi:hypothetical protein
VKRQILRLLSVFAIAGGGLLAFGAPAQAQISFGNSGFVTGNQFSSVIQVPVSACGNAIAIAGFASGSCHGGAYAVHGSNFGNMDDDGPMLSPLSRTWS